METKYIKWQKVKLLDRRSIPESLTHDHILREMVIDLVREMPKEHLLQLFNMSVFDPESKDCEYALKNPYSGYTLEPLSLDVYRFYSDEYLRKIIKLKQDNSIEFKVTTQVEDLSKFKAEFLYQQDNK